MLIFTTAEGTPVHPRNFNRSWDARCAKAGVRKITVHDARRTCGSLLADLDVHPRVAMAILRNARFAITMEIYTQVSSTATREALRRLGESLDGDGQLYGIAVRGSRKAMTVDGSWPLSWWAILGLNQ